MKPLATLTLVAMCTAIALAQGPTSPLSDDAVLAAIKAGETNKMQTLVSRCVATPGFGEGMAAGLAGGVQRDGNYDVVVAGPSGMIASAAARGRKLYKPVTLESIAADLREPAVFVTVDPQRPSSTSNTVSIGAVITHIVLKSKVRPDQVVQPVAVDTEPVEWGNLAGASFAGNRATARFDFAAVAALPAGDFDVVVIAEEGERRCKVGAKDRGRLAAR